MRRRGDAPEPDEPRSPGARPDRLSGVAPLGHDEDERPRREDMQRSSLFDIPVPIPRWLRPKRDREPKQS